MWRILLLALLVSEAWAVQCDETLEIGGVIGSPRTGVGRWVDTFVTVPGAQPRDRQMGGIVERIFEFADVSVDERFSTVEGAEIKERLRRRLLRQPDLDEDFAALSEGLVAGAAVTDTTQRRIMGYLVLIAITNPNRNLLRRAVIVSGGSLLPRWQSYVDEAEATLAELARNPGSDRAIENLGRLVQSLLP